MKIKFLLLSCLICIGIINANCQITFSLKTFDLEAISKEKLRFYGGAINADGNYIIKSGSAKCEANKENFLTGTNYAFYGVEWSFSELIFDKDFNYLKKEDKIFKNTIEASSYVPVWGGKFRPLFTEGFGAILSGNQFSSDLIGKQTVLISNNLGKAIINKGAVVGSIYGNVGKYNTYGCVELPVLKHLSKINPKEEKGQRWAPIAASHGIEKGTSLFFVSGTGFPDDKFNYVLNRYNIDLEVEKSLKLPLDYSNTIQFADLKEGAVSKEYVLIVQGNKKYAPKNLAIKEPDFVEIIVIDAQSLEIKWREISKLPYSQWFVQHISYLKDGSIFIGGPCSESKKEYLGNPGGVIIVDGSGPLALGNNAKNLPNFQTMILKDNKIAKTTGISQKEAASKLLVLTGNEIKVKSEPVFTTAISDAQGTITDNVVESKSPEFTLTDSKIILSYLTHVDGNSFEPKRNGIANLIFNTDGVLEKYILFPAEDFTTFDVFVSKDQKNVSLVNYELNSLNKVILKSGVFEPKSIKNMIGAELQIARVSLNDFSATPIETIGKKQFAVNAKYPVITETEDEVLFLGRTLNKKAKDSELTFIKVSK